MRYQVVAIFFSLLTTACSSQHKVVDSPLFDKTAGIETKEDLEKLPKITQREAIEKIDTFTNIPPPPPRSVFIADRKTPPQTQEIRGLAAATQTKKEMNEYQEYVIYTAKGGEHLSFIARSLLGSPQKTSLLKEWNPHLSSSILDKGQEVKVKVEALKPQAIYLSRNFVITYKDQLRNFFKKSAARKTYFVKSGDTLQTISQLLYSTTRRWTELYLLNLDKMTSPDSLARDTELKHY
ncbi:MAG: LysM peptidoglycan-binding domain-containing protein [Pseudobdellovibrionaceae bacterium]